jgi:hypothetical protein
MHGDYSRFEEVNIKKKLKKKDTLIVCGDFGFIWDGSKEEEKILKKIGEFNFDVLFIDGKHENFDLIKKFEKVSLNDGTARNIFGNLYYLIRGEIYKIENNNFFVLGGGESQDHDREVRMELGKWWKEEMPSFEEISNATEKLNLVNREVDYIITHEPPGYIKNLSYKFSQINFLNTFFDSVSKEVAFKKWFFGSLHLDKAITSKHIAVFNNVVPVENIAKKHLFRRKKK